MPLFFQLALVLESAYYPRSLLTDLSLNRHPLLQMMYHRREERETQVFEVFAF